jgi:hypothetical protein
MRFKYSTLLALPDFDDFLDIPVFVFDFVLGMLLTAGIEPYVRDISVNLGDVINVEFLHDDCCELKVKCFLDPLHGTGRNAADLRSVPYRLTAFEGLDDGGVFGSQLVQGFHASPGPAHLHALLDCKLPPLVEAESDILTFLLGAEGQAADVDGHDSVDFLPVEEPEALLLEVHVNFVVDAVFDRLQNFPYLTASTGEFGEEDNADVVILGIGEAFLKTEPFAVLLGPADVFLKDAFHPNFTGFGILEE